MVTIKIFLDKRRITKEETYSKVNKFISYHARHGGLQCNVNRVFALSQVLKGITSFFSCVAEL